MPDVSILMPLKNASPFLDETLQSISRQTMQSWELVIVDDGSIDDSVKIALKWAEKDARIRVLYNLESGIIPALKHALHHSAGRYITRMDADDLMPQDRLKVMSKALASSKPKTVITGLVHYFGAKISKGYQAYEQWINEINVQNKQWQQIYRECVIASPNWMVRRGELQLDQLTYPEDYDLVFDWYKRGFQVKCIPKVTLLWREHPARTSRNSLHYQQEVFFKLKISRFLELDLQDANLCLWGNNQKTALIKKLLDTRKIAYQQFELTSYRQILQVKEPKLLVGVWPDEKQKAQIAAFLEGNDLIEGKHWWYV